MTQYNKLRIEWDCRRGMLELDNVIMPFYRQHFDALSDTQKNTFIRLLACSDLQLFSWFFNRGTPTDPQLQQMVDYIQKTLKLTD